MPRVKHEATACSDEVKVTDRPDLYDWLYEDVKGDIPMYESLARSHTKDLEILECGIGTGRIAIPLAQSGITVYGIDNSPCMLQSLGDKLENCAQEVQKRICFREADMRDFDLKRKFPFIYVPFSTFNYLLGIDEQKASLASIRKHLSAQGTLVLEILSFSLYSGLLVNDTHERFDKKKPAPGSNKIIEYWKRASFDSANQLVREHRYFRYYSKGKLEHQDEVIWENRFFFLGEIMLLLEQSGFQIEKDKERKDRIYGDWKFGTYKHDSEFAVIVAKAT